MNGFKQFGREIAAVCRNPKLMISVSAVLLVPLMYSSMFVGAFWDPYAKLDKLPVAVVNSDQGAEMNGEEMKIGEDFVEKLKENKGFQWDFVSGKAAEEGLSSNKYYMAIEIPEDFSEKTASLTTDHPEQAEIAFIPNESLNFLAAQIGTTAVEKMRAELNKEVTEAYTRTVFEQAQTLADGLQKASGGAGEIAQGTEKAKEGAELLASHIGKLAKGSGKIDSGIVQLNQGSKALTQGTAQLQTGSNTLTNGLRQIHEGAGTLGVGAEQANQGAAQLADGLKASSDGSAKVATGAKALAAGLEQYAEAVPALAQDADFRRLVASSKQLAAGAEAVSAGQQQLAEGARQLSGGTARLDGGLEQLASKLGEAEAGSAKLAQGVSQVNAGAARLAAGLDSLDGNYRMFDEGVRQLEAGAQALSDALLRLSGGTDELSGKLGAAAMKTEDLKAGDDKIGMFAEPVTLNVEKRSVVPNYGTGFAPYFLSLGLFVGALLITIVYSVKKPASRPTGGWSWFAGKLFTLATVGILQALLADAVLLYGLGMQVKSVPLFVFFSILTSIAFMSLIQFLVTVFQNPGRFAAIVILILQLTSSAGTFPLELIPDWMQKISAILPMTHTVTGLKAVVSSGNYADLWSNAVFLAAFAAAFALLTLIYFNFTYRKEYLSKSAQTKETGDNKDTVMA
jgi:putative membrane protein